MHTWVGDFLLHRRFKKGARSFYGIVKGNASRILTIFVLGAIIYGYIIKHDKITAKNESFCGA